MIKKIELAARNVQAADVILVGLRARHLYSLIFPVHTHFLISFSIVVGPFTIKYIFLIVNKGCYMFF